MILYPCEKQVLRVPNSLYGWDVRLKIAQPTEFGKIALVFLAPAKVETVHQVLVVDEAWNYITGLPMLFGFPGGDGRRHPVPASPYWDLPLAELNGNLTETMVGYAEHVYHSGGETIFPLGLKPGTDEIVLSSDIIFNATFRQTPRFVHTGVLAVYQVQRAGIKIADQPGLS